MSNTTLDQKLEELTPARLFKWLAWLLAGAFSTVISVFAFYLMTFYGGLSNSNTDWGTFGDFFGGTLNPILSFLGLVALLLTIVLQSKELESSSTELRRAASAQESTKRILDEQSATQIKQQFEGTFFALLEQHNKLLERLTTARATSKSSRTDMGLLMQLVFADQHSEPQQAKSELESRNSICGNYFRMLYQLLKFIATNHPGSKIGNSFLAYDIKNTAVTHQEKLYSNIVRSFLDYDTTQLLAVNCYCIDEKDSYWKYKLLLERYSFLEHMPFVINGKSNPLLEKLRHAYEEQAFGNSDFLSGVNYA